jgi:lactoylglutathione lyase
MRVYLQSKGVAVPPRVPRARIGTSNFNCKDPDGHTVEFVQYQPDSWAARERGKFMTGERISTRMRHVGVLVRDFSRSMRFYGDILGFEETWRGARNGSATLSWANLRVPDGTDYLEFMFYTEEPPPDRRGVQHHLSLEVPNVDEAKARLEQRPYRKGYTREIQINTGVNRRRQINLYDPDGTRVELMEPATVDGVPAPSSTLPAPVAK